MSEITIVYPPTVDWYLLFQRPQQMMKAMSEIDGVRCIFVSSEVYQKLPNPVMEVSSDLFVVDKNVDYDSLVKGKKVYWFSYPGHYGYKKGRDFDFTVFDAIDNPADEFSDWKNGLTQSVAIADLICCTADVMYESHKNSGKPIMMLPNAADYDHFQKGAQGLATPLDFPAFEDGEKVIGFYGAMASWVDFELVRKIAEDYKVVLIGNNKYYQHHINHPNITTLDHRSYGILPNYLAQFHATIVPFKLTEMIEGCDPIKFYEYLAAGKPVLATEMIELKKYEDVTYFINHDNYKEVIEKAFTENNINKVKERQAVAKEQSWKARAVAAVNKIRELI